jgi:preprotein translocase subunit SecG
MTTFFLIIHVTVSLLLIFIVLIQGGKGAQMGAAFGGGSSQTVFGGRGAATFLGKMTTVVAVVFMITSLLLAIASVKGTSIIKETLPVQERPTAAPEQPQMPPPGDAAPLEQPLKGGAPASPLAPAGQQTQ